LFRVGFVESVERAFFFGVSGRVGRRNVIEKSAADLLDAVSVFGGREGVLKKRRDTMSVAFARMTRRMTRKRVLKTRAVTRERHQTRRRRRVTTTTTSTKLTEGGATATWLYVPLSPREADGVEGSFELQPVELSAERTDPKTRMQPSQHRRRHSMPSSATEAVTSRGTNAHRAVPFYVPSYEGALMDATTRRNADMHRVRNWETQRSAIDTMILIGGVAAVFAMIVATNIVFGLLLPMAVQNVTSFACRMLSNNGFALAMSRFLAIQLYFAL